MKVPSSTIFAVLCIGILLLCFAGCSSSSSSTSTTTSSADALNNSIIDLPSSISTTSGGGRRSGGGSNGGILGLYSGIRHYAGFAEMMAVHIKQFMHEMLSHPGLFVESNYGKDIYPNDPNAPYKVRIDKNLPGESYEYKLSFYMDQNSTTPEMISRFTLVGDAAKGKMLWNITDYERYLDPNYGIDANIAVQRTVEVVFDGTQAAKTLDVRMIQDITQLVSNAQAKCSSYATDTNARTAIVEDIFDLGQPTKVSLHAESDGTVVTMYATSYHAGWQLYTTSPYNLEQAPLFDSSRSIYSFRAKAYAEDAAQNGARVDLALPLVTATSVDWTADTFSQLLVNYINANFPSGTMRTLLTSYFGKMVNSAFFADSGVIGFYDGTTYYKYDSTITTPSYFPDNLVVTTDLSSISYLTGTDFSLSGITVASPKSVVDMTITME